MAATVMSVEFGINYHYSSLDENSKTCLCSSLDRYKNSSNNYVNCDIFEL